MQRTYSNNVAFISLLIALCIHVSAGTGSAQGKRRVLNYEPANVTLTGVVVSKTYYGPPNYGENPKTDAKETQYILVLDSPVDVVGDQNTMTKTERGVKRITLVIHDFNANPVEPLLGRRVEVSGTLFHAHTAHHHTKVLINVTSIKKVTKANGSS